MSLDHFGTVSSMFSTVEIFLVTKLPCKDIQQQRGRQITHVGGANTVNVVVLRDVPHTSALLNGWRHMTNDP